MSTSNKGGAIMPKFNKKDISINIRLNSNEYNIFRKACKKYGFTSSRMIRLLINRWVYQTLSYNLSEVVNNAND